MDIEIELEKSLEQNASAYFEKSKKAKKKLQGLKQAMLGMEKKISKAGKKGKERKLARKRKRLWFESFHWFKTSSGLLVIGGKDARSNEAAVKKHLEKGDMFLHADIQGGSACVVKGEGREISKEDLLEAAQFAAVWSKAWQQKLASVDVYAVEKDQVSKSAPSGEALSTGGFMIYGKRQWFRKTPLRFALGLLEEGKELLAMSGPPTAVKKQCISKVELAYGKGKRSDVGKAVLKRFEKKMEKRQVSLEDIIAILPGEGLEIKEIA